MNYFVQPRASLLCLIALLLTPAGAAPAEN
jgi:hypothetical protein